MDVFCSNFIDSTCYGFSIRVIGFMSFVYEKQAILAFLDVLRIAIVRRIYICIEYVRSLSNTITPFYRLYTSWLLRTSVIVNTGFY